jgi:hypothetical protein
MAPRRQGKQANNGQRNPGRIPHYSIMIVSSCWWLGGHGWGRWLQEQTLSHSVTVTNLQLNLRSCIFSPTRIGKVEFPYAGNDKKRFSINPVYAGPHCSIFGKSLFWGRRFLIPGPQGFCQSCIPHGPCPRRRWTMYLAVSGGLVPFKKCATTAWAYFYIDRSPHLIPVRQMQTRSSITYLNITNNHCCLHSSSPVIVTGLFWLANWEHLAGFSRFAVTATVTALGAVQDILVSSKIMGHQRLLRSLRQEGLVFLEEKMEYSFMIVTLHSIHHVSLESGPEELW